MILHGNGWEELFDDMFVTNGEKCINYEDAAYNLLPFLIVPEQQITMKEATQAFNEAMSAVQVAVEWNYCHVKQQWKTNDFARMLKVR